LEEFATELVDTMLQSDRFDFVAEFADPFPTKIFCELAGFPLEDYEQIMDWKNTLMHANDGHSRGRQLAIDLATELGLEPGDRLTADQEMAVRGEVGQRIYAYLAELIERARSQPGPGMVSQLLEASYEGERPLTQEELEDTLFLFYMAGLDTVASALGLIVETFAKDPAKRHEFIELMEDSERLDAAVEELVRYHAIVLLPRRVTGATTFHGIELDEGETIMCPTMAANRDPGEFEAPHELRFDRIPNRHIGFGLGPHRCIGIHLARRELRIALQTFHRRCPDYHIAPEGGVEAFGGMKGLAALPLVKG
jgi:cytochrome P450